MLGPYLIGTFRQYQLDHGVPKAQVYSTTMYVLAGLLALGLLCNLLIKPVAEKNFMTLAQIAELDRAAAATDRGGMPAAGAPATPSPGWLITVGWLAVGIPIAWGVWVTLQKAAVLFS